LSMQTFGLTDWASKSFAVCIALKSVLPSCLGKSRNIPFSLNIMDKIKQLETEIADLELQAKETELAVNEALAQEWSFLARSAERRNDTSAMLRRMYEANTYAKLALDLKAELNNWK